MKTTYNIEFNVTKINLLDLDLKQLKELVASIDEKPYRASQIAAWLYRRKVSSFQEMTDIKLETREKLEKLSEIRFLELLEIANDDDGSAKILWKLHDGHKIESVLIKEKDHYTLCLSSQVGCAMGCAFCRTATLGFKRNLTQGEILGQYLGALKVAPEGTAITNIVFMGMGEPLMNAENTCKAINILTDSQLAAVAQRHISVSSVGIIPKITQLDEETKTCLTISLTAVDDDLRSRLMPINKKYPLAELKKALMDYPLIRRRRLTIAYVLLKDVNDSLEHAKKLSLFLTGLKVKINLIPFNPWPGSTFKAPAEKNVNAFRQFLLDKNYTVIVRHSKGKKTGGACGQLAGERVL